MGKLNKALKGRTTGFLEIRTGNENTPNHTIMIFGDCKMWITALTSKDPTLNEYRVSFEDGVVRYFTILEMIGTPFEQYIPVIEKLTDKVDENKIRINNGDFEVRN
jgi:hypothetical protein